MMSHFTHVLATYGRFIWRELLCFWIVSILASIWAWQDPVEFPANALTVLEIVAWLWLTVRLMLAESAFLAQGGWQVRPVVGSTWWRARWSIYLLAILVSVILRSLCLSWTLGWSWGQWWHWGALPAVTIALTLVLAAGSVGFAGKWSRGGDIQRWVVGTACVAVGLCLAALGVASTAMTAGPAKGGNSGSGFSSMPQGLAAVIPAGDSAIARNNAGGRTPSELGLRIAAHVPLRLNTPEVVNGIHFNVTTLRQKGRRLELLFEAVGPPRAFKGWHENFVFAVRYANGMWGYQVSQNRHWSSVFLPGFHYMHRNEGGEILSPLTQPWVTASMEELLQGAHLYLLVPDASIPLPAQPNESRIPLNFGRKENTIDLPTLSPNPSIDEIAAAARAAVAQFHIDRYSEHGKEAGELLTKLGAAAVPSVLDCAPFAKHAWEGKILNFLTQHTTEQHLPRLQKMIPTDPQMADLMIAKGWTEAALPALRQHLQDRIHLSPIAFKALVDLRDPALGNDLVAQVLLARNDLPGDIIQLLRDHPGVDWLNVVRSVCHKSMAEGRGVGDFWLEYAAPLGNQELLRAQAARWLTNQNPPSTKTVNQWIAPETWNGDPKEFAAWIRGHFAKLRWDDAKKRWVL